MVATLMPETPSCNLEEKYKVRFGTKGKLYTLDADNARKLSANIQLLKVCIEEFVLYSQEVEHASKTTTDKE